MGSLYKDHTTKNKYCNINGITFYPLSWWSYSKSMNIIIDYTYKRLVKSNSKKKTYTTEKQKKLNTRHLSNAFSIKTNGVLYIMPNQLVRDQWEYQRKCFPIKLGKPGRMSLTIFHSLLITPLLGQRTAWSKLEWQISVRYSNRNKWTTFRGDPGYLGPKKTKMALFNSNHNFRIVGIMESTPGFHSGAELFKLNFFLL